MQEHGGAAAEAAITSSERRFLHEILVDWNQDGEYDHELTSLGDFADEISLDRQLSGTAPAEILLIEGAAAAEMSLVMGGEYNNMPLTGVFSPYNPLSPFFGKDMVGAEITYRIGVETPVGVFWYPQFVGNIRTVTPHRADNSVEITALDRVEKLRRPILLPPWAVSDIHVNFGELDSQLCRSHWVIDHALRLCDVGPSPKRPLLPEEFANMIPQEPKPGEGLGFFLTGNGSYLPTIGWLDNPSAMTFPADGTPMYEQIGPVHPDAPPGTPRPLAFSGLGTPIRESGPYVSPANYQGVIRYWMETRDLEYPDDVDGYTNQRPNSSHYLGFTINTNGPDGQLYRTVDLHQVMEVRLGHFFSLYLEVEDGRIRTRFQQDQFEDLDLVVRTGAWQTLPTGVDHIDIFCVWDLYPDPEEGFTWRMSINGVDTGIVPAGAYVNAHEGFYDQIGGRITIGQALSLSDVFYGVRDAWDPLFETDRVWRTPKYRADLDIGKNRFTSMPSTEPREAWDIITEVAAAEMGAVFWDEEGVFRFWNLDTIQQKQGTTVRRLSLDHASDLVITNSLDSVRNVYTIAANKKRAVIHRTVFEADDVQQFYVPARTVRYFKVWAADGIQSPLPFKLTRYVSEEGNPFAPYWDDNVVGGYCVQFLEDDQWAERPEFVSGVDINAYFTTDGALIIRIWNGYELDARLASGLSNASEDNSSPAFRLSGTQIIDDANDTVWARDYDSMEKYGARNLELSGDWYQDSVEGSALITQLVQRTSRPTPTTDAIEIAGDPRLQLGDTIAIYDPQGMGNDVRLQILGINRTYSRDGGLRDTLTVEMINPAGRPPVVDAGDNLSLGLGERRTLQATYMDYGAPNVSVGWEILDGPDRIGETVSGTEFDFVATAEGSYVLQFSLSSDYGSAADTITITSSVSTGGGGLPADPAEALHIARSGGNWYNLGLGMEGGGTNHVDHHWDELLNGFTDPNRFYLNDVGNVIFEVNVDAGRTSENTQYPRSELRELKINGSDDSTGHASWDGGTGNHYMEYRFRVPHLTETKPWVCVGQIHDASSDLIRVLTEVKSGVLTLSVRYSPPGGGTEQKYTLIGNYDPMEFHTIRIWCNNGNLGIDLDGVTKLSGLDGDTTGCYFKLGAYSQSNTSTEDGDASQYFQVEIVKGSFITWHSGYPDTTMPDFTGGTSDGPYHRLYLSNDTGPWTPGTALSLWNVDAAAALTNVRHLAPMPEGVSTAVTATETVATNPYEGLIRQFVSNPAEADGTLSGKIRMALGGYQSHANGGMQIAVCVWVSQGSAAAVRGTGYSFIAVDPIGTAAGGWELELDISQTAVPGGINFLAGDRLIVEVGYQATNTVTTPRSFTMYCGGDGIRDLKRTDSDMNLPPWMDFQTTGGKFGALV